MNIRTLAISVVLGAATVVGLGQSARAETLADAMASAYSHSGILEQNRALLRAADEDVAIAISALRPIISWTTQAQRNYSASGGFSSATTSANLSLNFSWTFSDSGETQANIEAQKQTVLATRQSLIGVEQNVLFNAVQAFMNVRQSAETVALQESFLRLITRELRAANDRFEVGEDTRTDVALAEARLAAARAQLAFARGQLLQAQEVYAAVVGRRPGNLVAPRSVPVTVKTVDEARDYAVRQHPDLLAAQHSVAAAEARIFQARAAMWPDSTLTSSLTRTETVGVVGGRTTGSVGVTLSGPLYRGGQLSAALRKAMAGRDSARGSLHNTRHNIRSNVGQAWAQVLSARAQREASARQIQASRLAYEGVREEQRLGARTTLDVLNAEQELLDAQAAFISAESTEFTAAYGLLAAMGLLTVDHMKLDVVKYDAAEYYEMVKDAPAIVSNRGRQLDKVLQRLGKE